METIQEVYQEKLIPEPIVLGENIQLISKADGSKEISSNGEALPCSIKYHKPDRFGKYGGWALELKIPTSTSALNRTNSFTLALQYNTETKRWSIIPDSIFTSDLIDRKVIIESAWTGNVGGESSQTYSASRRKEATDRQIQIFLEQYEQLAIKAMSCLEQKQQDL